MHGVSKNINGAIAKLTEAHVRKGLAAAKHGTIYSLAVVTSPESHSYPGRDYQALTVPIYIGDEKEYGDNKLGGIDDYICIWCGVGTHMDGFGHVAVHGRHLNGAKTEDVIHARGAKQFGVETIPPIASRGIMLDICRLKGVAQLASDYEVTRQDIDDACVAQDVNIQDGDIVLIHTGLITDVENKREYTAHGTGSKNLDSEPGIGLNAAKYLVEEKGAVALGSDNWALEVIPAPEEGHFLPVHGYLLAEKGVHIMENVWTSDLARDRVYEFFFVVAGPKWEGAVQMPIHPIAIV